MKPIEIVSQDKVLELTNLSPCHFKNTELKEQSTNRDVTEEWLNRKIEDMDLKFHYFITLSFYKGNKSAINQYLDNEHIKKVILDFFYPNNKPKNRIRLWFFVEQHKNKKLHIHFLMEGIDGITWMSKNNRKIILHKKTLYDIIANDFSMDDVITEALTNHLKEWVNKLGRGKKSTKVKYIGDFDRRVHYVNKSLTNLDFNNWEHIDYENSDL